MEEIVRRTIADPERADVQEAIAKAVEADSSEYIRRYCEDPRSIDGRYICADLFKEVFEPYRASRESRSRYNNCVHNTAAALAGEQFRQVLTLPSYRQQARDKVVFLTGIPGAGKTSLVLSQDDALADDVHAIFEGQMAKPATTIPKVRAVLEEGLRPVIFAVHVQPEFALRNTFKRFKEEGRGASVGVMSQIMGGLPDGLREVYCALGDAVALAVVDARNPCHRRLLLGWNHLQVLESAGNEQQIRQRLETELEREWHAGRIDADCYQQARGAAPVRQPLGLGEAGASQHGADVAGRGLPQGSGQEAFLSEIGKPDVVKGSYWGRIERIDRGMVVQHVGRGVFVGHDVKDIRVSGDGVCAGQTVSVNYRDGVGQVTARRARGIEGCRR